MRGGELGWYGKSLLRSGDWQLISSDEMYVVYHFHFGSQWWHTIGEGSQKGWRCAECGLAVPYEMRGFISLLEWNR